MADRREILVPFGYRALAEMRRDDLEGVVRADAETVAADGGLELPADPPTIVDTWIDARRLSAWAADRIDELDDDVRDGLAFAYWSWEVDA